MLRVLELDADAVCDDCPVILLQPAHFGCGTTAGFTIVFVQEQRSPIGDKRLRTGFTSLQTTFGLFVKSILDNVCGRITNGAHAGRKTHASLPLPRPQLHNRLA